MKSREIDKLRKLKSLFQVSIMDHSIVCLKSMSDDYNIEATRDIKDKQIEFSLNHR